MRAGMPCAETSIAPDARSVSGITSLFRCPVCAPNSCATASAYSRFGRMSWFAFSNAFTLRPSSVTLYHPFSPAPSAATMSTFFQKTRRAPCCRVDVETSSWYRLSSLSTRVSAVSFASKSLRMRCRSCGSIESSSSSRRAISSVENSASALGCIPRPASGTFVGRADATLARKPARCFFGAAPTPPAGDDAQKRSALEDVMAPAAAVARVARARRCIFPNQAQ
mmetsp:Transcript_41076/g.126820  ORF Transcript_41076/g.126820 Transcript_41076/m.126820 type:complete len:224 (-) Transcript_41076:20-691(-)